ACAIAHANRRTSQSAMSSESNVHHVGNLRRVMVETTSSIAWPPASVASGSRLNAAVFASSTPSGTWSGALRAMGNDDRTRGGGGGAVGRPAGGGAGRGGGPTGGAARGPSPIATRRASGSTDQVRGPASDVARPCAETELVGIGPNDIAMPRRRSANRRGEPT